jgi:predicted amidohydrolase
VLPELFTTGYQFTSIEEVKELAEYIPEGPSCKTLIKYARSKNIYLAFGIAERRDDKFFNSAVLIGPDGFLGKYRKSHLFFEEKLFFSPGDTGFNVFDIGICHPANLVLNGCQKAMQTRSLENAVYCVTANRTGAEARGGKDELRFTGQSQIADPAGNVILSLDSEKEGIGAAYIDVGKARDKTITSLNDRFTDRRPDLYGFR